MNIENLNTELYSIKHISDNDFDIIRKFRINKKEGRGLEIYLKGYALNEEKTNEGRTYLIIDNETKEVVAYFTLKAGLVTQKIGLFKFNNSPGIEIANFAVNDAYREAHDDIIPQIGKYIFSEFIYPIIADLSTLLGIAYVYIFALPQNRLMKHYESMGFTRMDAGLERFLHRHVRPEYDRGCIFMYQRI
jgi:hypothetical protein